jgi:putative NADH-flavin reductase
VGVKKDTIVQANVFGIEIYAERIKRADNFVQQVSYCKINNELVSEENVQALIEVLRDVERIL